MGLWEPVATASIWMYLIPLILLTIILLVMLVKRYQRELTLAHMARNAIKAHVASKGEFDIVEKLESRQLLLVNEALFVVGFMLAAIGYVKEVWVAVALGAAIILLTLYVLQSVLRTGKEPGHHLISLFEKKGSEEEEISRIANMLLLKEKTLARKESEIKKQLETLYHLAVTIDAKDMLVREKVKKAMDPEVKKVLRTMDDLLENLPEKTMEKFIKSSKYRTYKRVMGRIK